MKYTNEMQAMTAEERSRYQAIMHKCRRERRERQNAMIKQKLVGIGLIILAIIAGLIGRGVDINDCTGSVVLALMGAWLVFSKYEILLRD